MVFILALLSLMLTLGGGATALYGADLIRSESGLALTGAGVTMATAGILLMGVTAVLSELRKMRRLMELEEAAPPPAPPRPAVAMPAIDLPPLQHAAPADPVDIPPPPSPQPRPPFSLRDIDPPERPVSGGGIPAEAMASLMAGTPLVRGKGAVGPRVEPLAAIPATAAAVVEPAGAERASAAVPTGSPFAPPAPAGAIVGPGAAVAEAVAEGAGTLPSPGEAATHPAQDGPRKILATYNAGGITYFMYSDGSIEADLEAGRHRFGSMQELRHYIETGEGGTPVPHDDAVPAAGA